MFSKKDKLVLGRLDLITDTHINFQIIPEWLFVCVEVLRLSQPNGVMSSVVSLPDHKFTGKV